MYDTELKDSRLSVPGIFHPKDIELSPRRPLVRASVVFGMVLVLVVLVIGGWVSWQYGWPAIQPMLRLLTPAAARTAAVEQTVDVGQTRAAADAEAATQTATAAAIAAATEAATATATPVKPTETPTTASTATPVPPTATATAMRSEPVRSPTSTPRPTRTPTLTPTPSLTPAEGVTLSIMVTERAWLQVTIDGQELPGELLEAGQERSWEAQQTIYFICGNAGGVEVTVNGDELGTLGGRAEVVDRTWTPQGEATPTPQPS